MSQSPARRLVSEGVIGVSICAGAYFGLVDPAKQDLINARAATADASALQARALLQGDAPKRARDALTQALWRAGAIQDAGAPARDELIAFESLMRLAADHDLKVDQLQQRDLAPVAAPAPAPAPPPIASAPGAPALPPAPPPKDRKVGFVMSVTGTYEHLAHMLGALSANAETTAIESLTLAPAGDSDHPLVTATIMTVHYAFDASRARTLLQQALARLAEAEVTQ